MKNSGLYIAAAMTAGLALCATTATESPAEISIRKAQDQIALHPDHAPYYNALAMAYARRARETSDVVFYAKAEEAAERSLSVEPGNYEALKVKTWLLLGRHEFAKALDSARMLNRKMPDDVTVYGYLVDANAELGNYKAAVDAAQWMLNLKPGNIAGLTRAAYLREIHGDIEGAIELMRMAYDSTSLGEREDRAWLLVQISHLHLVAGDLKAAEARAEEALQVFPDYHYALGALGNIRMSQARYNDAAELYQRRYAAAPHAEKLFALAKAVQLAGRKDEAVQLFAKFETSAVRESNMADNANHELVEYYADYARQPDKALRIAEMELAHRKDVFTCDAHAWALAAAGRYAEAAIEMQRVVAIGIKDPSVRHHGEVIFEHVAAAAQNPGRVSR